MSEAKKITSRNASTLTTYELRQELVRRGSFDLDESIVSYKTMLQRLMQDLVAEESKEQEERVAHKAEDYKETVDKAKELRELKKQEALERSRQRQADREYFEAKAEANRLALEKAKEAPAAAVAEDAAEEELPTETSTYDPFRMVPSGRNKVFVK